MKDTKTKKPGLFNRFLNVVERTGNKLPQPITLFFILAAGIVVLSAILSAMGVSATGELINKETGLLEPTTVTVVSLLSGKGIVYMLESAVTNFTSFAPLGTVLVAMLGVGVAESSGYITGVLKGVVGVTPKQLITPVVVLLGVMSNIASDVGYVILIPIAAMMFQAYGKHPLAGLAAAFAGVSGGFSANLLIGTTDPLLTGITNEAIKLVDATYHMNPTGNMFFMQVSTLVITVIGTFVTEKIVIPRLEASSGNRLKVNTDTDNEYAKPLTATEKKALKMANLSVLVYVAVIVIACIPQNSILRNADTGSLIAKSPFMNSIILLLAILFFIPGLVYGFVSGKYTGEKDVARDLGKAMSSMGSYMALCFVAAQFIAYFNYSQIGRIIAFTGANFLKTANVGPIPLMLIFILFSAFINLFMGSASAKWTMLAPVFVPMFMMLGVSPELTQVAYRIGDSSTNIITPLMTYFAMITVVANKYDEEAGIGSLISTMLPYSICFLIGWSALLMLWMLIGLPLGPGAPLFYGA